jgi:hypothetical protein
MALYSATGALQQALAETPSKNLGKKVLDNFDVDFSILSGVNPIDAKPASAFAEASRSWDNTPPSIIVSQSNPYSRARSSKKPIATAFRDTPNLIPSRQVETVATPPQTKDMVTPTQVLANALDNLMITSPQRVRVTEIPTLVPGVAPVEEIQRTIVPFSPDALDSLEITTPHRVQLLPRSASEPDHLGGRSSRLYSSIPEGEVPEGLLDKRLSKNGATPSLDKGLLFKQKLAGNQSAADTITELGLDNEYAAFVQASAPRQSTNPAPPKTKTQSASPSAEKPVVAATEEVANLPWYKDLRYQLGIGVPVAALGAYGAYQMMQPAQEEVVYEAPAYGQMPRSFQG